jgi:Pyruvate/2-oxoacid:ferredoxin oxidoreductase delta subunit
LDEVAPVLERLAMVKRVIAAGGTEERKKYRLLPIMPGIFEMALIGESPEALSPWHRRFAELFEALYETGYFGQYLEAQKRPSSMFRFLPVGRVIDAHPMALPSDRLEVLLDRYDTFGLGQCQCRMAMQVTGRGCGKPTQNCTVMGQWAEQGIQYGWLKPVSREEVLRVKREAEEHGMVNWVMNVEGMRGQASCSCCGCCCHAMRMVNEFNAPAAMAPPHFLPRFDDARCIYCGKCVKHCPMGALAMDLEAKAREHRLPRCIGCGLCAVACGDRRAVTMEPVPDHKLPYRSWFSMLVHTGPGMLRTAWKVWRSR